ncbi:MAG: alpha/beta hydrolase family protein, partial [Myxococcota bacterium]
MRALARRACVASWTAWLAIAAGAAPAAGPSASALFAAPAIRQMTIDPSGEILASIVRRKGRDRVALRKRDASGEVYVQTRLAGVRRLEWIDDRHLLVRYGSRYLPAHLVVGVSEDGGSLELSEERVSAKGAFVDLLPSAGEEVLWSVRTRAATSVYRVALSDLVGDGGGAFSPEEERRVARLRGGVTYWVADSDAVPRAALTLGRGSQKSKLWYRDSADADWRLLKETEKAEDVPRPHGMAANGRDLIVTAKGTRDTLALFELSAETGELGREVFAHPDADVVGVFTDYATREVIGAVYERDGLPQYHHLDSFLDRYQRSLAHALPGVVPTVAGTSRDRRYLVVVTSGPREPGSYYVLDTETNTATRVARSMPWIDPSTLADVEAHRLASTGGIEVEAFLTRPRDVERPPLVVLPHGGPSLVRDTRAFDPLVQFLAAGGLAVLQVNYRGSGGRGQSFLDAGKRQWGRGIEEDLEAAFDHVVERGIVDG